MQRLKQSAAVAAILFTLAVMAYTGHLMWARHLARGSLPSQSFEYDPQGRITSVSTMVRDYPFDFRKTKLKAYLDAWRRMPWYGSWHRFRGWVPRRTFYEVIRNETGKDFGNDPDAWERGLSGA